jgi:hypothetical protein
MIADTGRARPALDTDVVTRAAVVPALSALAVIHVVDLPGTLGPTAWSGSVISRSSLPRSWPAGR